MGFKNFLRDYFTFNRRERNGVFVLLSIIFLLILYLSFSDLFLLQVLCVFHFHRQSPLQNTPRMCLIRFKSWNPIR